MPIVQFVVDKSGAGGNSYGNAQTPDIDLRDLDKGGSGVNQFTPDYFLIRSDASNVDELLISFDGTTDGMQMPIVANNGGYYIRVDSHSRKVWVKRIGAPNAAAIALISACTRA